MFLKNSRYFNQLTVSAVDAQGRAVQAVVLRRLPSTPGETTVIQGHDQLDVMSYLRYQDGTRFWHIADANSELEANSLVESVGRSVDVPVT